MKISLFKIYSVLSVFLLCIYSNCMSADHLVQKSLLGSENHKKRSREENIFDEANKKNPSIRALILDKIGSNSSLDIHDFAHIDDFLEEIQNILAEETDFHELFMDFLFKISDSSNDVSYKNKAQIILIKEAEKSVLSDVSEEDKNRLSQLANIIFQEKSFSFIDCKEIIRKLKEGFLNSPQSIDVIVDCLKDQKHWLTHDYIDALECFFSMNLADREKSVLQAQKIIKSEHWMLAINEFIDLLKIVNKKNILKNRLDSENIICTYSFNKIMSTIKSVVSVENYTQQGFISIMNALIHATFIDLDTIDYATYIFDNKKYTIHDLVEAINIFGNVSVSQQANIHLIVQKLLNNSAQNICEILRFLEKYIVIFFNPDRKNLFSTDDLSCVVKTLYEKTQKLFYKYLYSESLQKNEDFRRDIPNRLKPSSVFFIYNQDGYMEKQTNISEKDIKGSPLKFAYKKKIYPIGYSIYFHENLKEMNNIDAIKVTVYGGDKKSDLDSKRVFSRKKFNFEENYFTDKNIMLIKLNLPDLLQDTHQSSMKPSFANILQKTIHCFWETLKYYPESIHEELKNLKNKNIPMYLSGASFGALMASYQADRYPGTWSGYIAEDAFLCTEENKKYDLIDSGAIYSLKSCNIFNLADPFFMTGNAHDNNVNMRHWPSFYKKSQDANKQNFIYSWFFYKGTTEVSDCLSDTGHYAPKPLKELNKYCEALRNFMVNRKFMYSEKKIVKMHPDLTAEKVSEWINEKGLIKSYENDISASAEDLFLAEAYSQTKKNPLISKEDLQKIFTVFHVIKHQSSRKILDKIFTEANKEHFQNGIKRDYTAWWNFAQSYVEKVIAETSLTHRSKDGPDLDFIPYLTNIYKGFLLDVVFLNDPFAPRRDRLSFIRAIRSFLVSNIDLLEHVHPKTLRNAENHFQVAYKRWMDWKASMALLVPNHPILSASLQR